MKEKTPKDDRKRIFESALDVPQSLRLKVRGESSREENDGKNQPVRKTLSKELLSRIVDCVEEL